MIGRRRHGTYHTLREWPGVGDERLGEGGHPAGAWTGLMGTLRVLLTVGKRSNRALGEDHRGPRQRGQWPQHARGPEHPHRGT